MRTSNELPLPGQRGAHVSVNAEESKVKHDHSYAMKPPPYVIFPTYEDDSFNTISQPPLNEIVVLRTTKDDESVVGNENGDDDEEEDEDLDPHWLSGKEKCTEDDNLPPEDEMSGTVLPACPTVKRNTWYLIHVSIVAKKVSRQHGSKKTIGSMLSIELNCHRSHTTY